MCFKNEEERTERRCGQGNKSEIPKRKTEKRWEQQVRKTVTQMEGRIWEEIQDMGKEIGRHS